MVKDADGFASDSPNYLLNAMAGHIEAMNYLSKSLADKTVVEKIETEGKLYKKEYIQGETFFWRGADIQVIQCEQGSSEIVWQKHTTPIGYGGDDPCPSVHPFFLAGLINRLSENAFSYLDHISKYYWYGRIAETAQSIASRKDNVPRVELAREIIFNQIAATNELRRMLIEHMKKRINSKTLYEQGWRLYFAYGKNVNKNDMLSPNRAPEAKFIMADYIENYKFIIDVRGVASIIEAPGHQAWGVLWAVSPNDLTNLDRAEGISRGFYRRETANTSLFSSSAEMMAGAENEQSEAFVYISNSAKGSVAREGYIEGIVEGLRDAHVPEEAFSYYESYIPITEEKKEAINQSILSAESKKQKQVTSEPLRTGFMPADKTLPFFAYGLFKEGEIGFERISEFVKFVENAKFPDGALLERDGLPLLVNTKDPEASDFFYGGVSGDIIIFEHEKSEQAYKRISEIEPDSQYIWGVVEILQMDSGMEPCRANALLAKRPGIGTNPIYSSSWNISDDHFYSDVIAFCRQKASDDSNAITKQAALLMAWSALERISAIKYSLKANSERRIAALGKDQAFVRALASTERKLGQSHPFRPIQDTRSTRKRSQRVFLFSKPDEAIDYLYQVRNNITHRGKGGYEADLPVIVASLDVLVLTIENLLGDNK